MSENRVIQTDRCVRGQSQTDRQMCQRTESDRQTGHTHRSDKRKGQTIETNGIYVLYRLHRWDTQTRQTDEKNGTDNENGWKKQISI